MNHESPSIPKEPLHSKRWWFHGFIVSIGLILSICCFNYWGTRDTQSRRDRIAQELLSAKRDVLGNSNAPAAMARIRRGALSTYSFERMYAVGTIGELGPKGKEGLPELIKALTDDDPYVSREAAIAAGKLGPAGQEIVSALIGLLEFTESDVSTFAAESLGNMGADAIPAVPALRVAARSSIRLLRDAARGSLKKLTGSEE